MFVVTRYDHPHIFVTCHRTGETYKFSMGSDGALTHPAAHSGQGAARRVAVQWLAQHGPEETSKAQAAECLEIARRTDDREGKIALLDIARAWLALADQHRKNSQATLVTP
jgi:hypothetical protein